MRILVIAPNWIGDCVFMTPLLKGISDAEPRACIDILCRPWVKDVFTHNPYINCVKLFERKNSRAVDRKELFAELKKISYDAGIACPPRSLWPAWFLKRSGCLKRIGYTSAIRKPFLTNPLRFPRQTVHDSDLFYALGMPLSVPKIRPAPCVYWSEEEEQEALCRYPDFRASQEPLVLLSPGAFDEGKCWPFANWVHLAEKLYEEGQCRVIVITGPREQTLQKALGEHLNKNITHITMPLTALKALSKHIALFVGNDTGPLHVVSAAGVLVLAIFGPSDPARTGPVGHGSAVIRKKTYCSPCPARVCARRACLNGIPVKEVYDAIKERLSRKENSR